MFQDSSVSHASGSDAHASGAGKPPTVPCSTSVRPERETSPFTRRGLKLPRWALATTSAAVVALVAGLAGCGGSVDQVDPFQAKRVVVLGDELSLLDADGRRHGVNQVAEDGITVQCSSLPTWTQTLAARFGLGFEGCPSTAGDASSVMRAAPGARAADLSAQIDGVAFGQGDLVTVTVGLHDVLTQYERLSEAVPPALATLVDELKLAGEAAAGQLCRVLATGAKLVVVTAPDLGLSPYGMAQGVEAAKRLTQLTDAFTGGLRLSVGNCRVEGDPADGWDWGLIDGQEKIVQTVKSPYLFGGLRNPANVVDAACLDASSGAACTTATLKDGASTTSWLWAQPNLPGPAWHRLVANGLIFLRFYPR